MKEEELNDLSKKAAIRVFPYTDEGSLEDDIDAAKRNIYQHGFIEGYNVAMADVACDCCGNHPSVIIRTPFGRFCQEHVRYI